MTLSDADVGKQIKNMMAFIEREANEKAEEIDAKAEEEFNIEKGRLVQQQRLKIMEYYERKEKQVELQRKIQSSNMLNQARLKVLKSCDDHLQSVLAKAKLRLVDIAEDQERYPQIVQDLVVQGLCQLLENNVVVRCRQIDVQLVESVVTAAVASFKEKTGKDCHIKLENENFLPSSCAGGVELYSQKGKIKVDNTLEARLAMVAHHKLPDTRIAMFGANKNRKFTD